MTSAHTLPLRRAAATVHARIPPHPALESRSSPDSETVDAEDALRALYRDHAAALLAFAEWSTGDRAAAEDAVQETFLRAWRHLPSLLADGRPPRPWLRQVLRNVLIDAARVARAHPVSLLDAAIIDRQVDGGYEDMLDRRLLDRALDQLSLAHRQVLVETYFHDAPAQRVAATLGIPPATVRSRLHYALRALRRVLTEHPNSPTATAAVRTAPPAR